MIEAKNFPLKKADWATKLIEKLYDISILDPFSILDIQDLLKDKPDLNLLIYFNHISYPDPAFVLWMYNKFIDPNLKRHTILPGSYFHTEFSHNPAFAAAFYAAKKLYSLESIRLIQSYMVNQSYTEEQAMANYREFISMIKESKEKGPVSLILSPEGHRSDDGLSLQEGDKGIVKLAQILAPVALLPVGLNYPDRNYDRSNLNLGSRVDVFLGKPIMAKDRSEVPSHDYLMRNLAAILPEDMRGFWQ